MILGFYDKISLPTVKNYLKCFGPHKRTLPGLIKAWLSFLRNHSKQIASIDFGSVITASFNRIHFFVVLSNDRRQIIHFNVCEQPYQDWVIRQIKEAFPYDSVPKYLIRDNDPVFGSDFNHTVKNVLGIKQVKTTPYSPWQNPFAERVIGTLKRECLDHFLIRDENHLRDVLQEHISYYNNFRPHMALNNSPVPKRYFKESDGKVVSIPVLNGIHHIYQRAA